jgi:hypothetical protein
MSDNKELLDELFNYHPPAGDQADRYIRLRKAARVFADAIDENCPCSADRTAAMRQLQTSLMTANRSIALGGKSYR